MDAGVRIPLRSFAAGITNGAAHRHTGEQRQHSRRNSGGMVSTTVTDDQIRQLAEAAKPYSLAVLRWGPERHMDGAEATELEHQRRMVSLRADGVITILCPVTSETLAGIAIMNVPPEDAREIMDGDPCVRARLMLCEVHLCHSFPGDVLPA